MALRVGRNAAFNAAGVVVPALCGVLAMPVLLENMGLERVGIFALMLGFYGFSGFFDFGLSRALTQSVAASDGFAHAKQKIESATVKVLLVSLILSTLWALLFYLLADFLTLRVFGLEDALQHEAASAMRWFAISLPPLLLSGCAIGLLEGLQLFAKVNLLRVPVSALMIVVPAVWSSFHPELDSVLAGMVGLRVLALVCWLLLIQSALRKISNYREVRASSTATKSLWRFSAWLSISNLVGPIIAYSDRFYLAIVYPMQYLAYYTVPLDTLMRAMGVPSAAANAVFPAIARAGVDSTETAAMFKGAILVTACFWALPLILLSSILPVVLELWLGPVFRDNSLELTRWLIFGVMLNGFSHIPYALMHAAGRTDLTARLHLLQLPLYFLMLWVFVSRLGAEGAAIAWSARMLVDAIMLYGVAFTQFKLTKDLVQMSVLVPLIMIIIFGVSVYAL
ncbi:oligosaccharide flippase family protein [Congregibacter sp.]|nr:oligosaccharide flippase family protein [Congregibacter sp.]MDA8961972.1 oligosaccharide flippase family protein [Congregibacter sp.]